MDIRADLLFDNLREHFSVIYCGKTVNTPLLRPVFYQEGISIEKNRIYMVRPGMMPEKHLLDASNLLICAEGLPSLSYQYSGLQLFILQNASIMAVFNEVLSIFERYDAWEKALGNSLNNNADISELVELTAPLILNDITVIDQDLRVIAAANYTRKKTGAIEVVYHTALYDTIPLHLLSKYQSSIEQNRNKRGGFFADYGCYCVNLYHSDCYYGNVSLFPMLSPLRPSDPYVIDVLAGFVKKALIQKNALDPAETSHFERIVHTLWKGEMVAPEKLAKFHPTPSDPAEPPFICFCIQPPTGPHRIPAESICQTLSKNLPNLVTFQHQAEIIGLMVFPKRNVYEVTFEQPLKNVLEQLNLYAGVSNRFHDIRDIRLYYQQAEYALTFREQEQGQRMSFFCDYTLHYLMANSTGSFPAKHLCPPRLLMLQKYDESSNVDYWGTLRCYLDEQMNLAQTAKLLGVHRNTLIQRIERIQNILAMDLKDPMNRLWLRIAIYLIDAEISASKS